MQLSATLCTLILAACTAQASPFCGDSKRDFGFNTIARRDASAAAEAFCGMTNHGVPCDSKRAAGAFFEATLVAKREAETSPEVLAARFCGMTKHGVPCDSKRASEAVEEALCGETYHGVPCDSKRDAILRREYSALLALRDL